MAKLTDDAIRDTRGRNTAQEDTAAIADGQTVRVGGLVLFSGTSQRLIPAITGSGHRPAGLCTEIVNNSGQYLAAGTGNSAGTVYARFEYGMEALVAVDAFTASGSNIGKNVFIKSDNDVCATALTGGAVGSTKIGSIASFASATTAWVRLRDFGDTDA